MHYDRFYLKLGNECNFNCNHCSQEKIKKDHSSHKVSREVIAFLDDYVTKHQDKKTVLRLWGGEPLLYFDTIHFLVSRYKNKFDYTMISNGSLLNKKIVNFINKNDIKFILSHDGPATEFTRNIDVLKNNSIKKQFDSIKKRSILSVINAKNPYYHTIFDYYKKFGYYDKMDIQIVWIVNHNGTDKQTELANIDIDEFRKGTRELFSRAKKHKKGIDYFPKEYSIAKCIINRCFTMQEITKKEFEKGSKYIHKCTNCGYFGSGSKLEFDIHGNVYDCHNSDNIIGQITETSDVLKKRIENSVDETQKEVSCEKCKHKYYCQGLCSKTVTAGDLKWCDLYKATYDELARFIVECYDV